MFSKFFSRINFNRFNDPAVVTIYANLSGPTPCEEYFYQKYLKRNFSLVELGIGGGRLVGYLREYSKAYIGVDYAEMMVDAAKARFPEADLRVMDAMNLETIPSASQDAVIFSMNGIDCLPSLNGRAKCIGEVHRVLKPGGYFIFSSHHSRGIVHWPDMSTDFKRKVWRVVRSGAISVHRAARRIFSPVFWSGEGFAYDPADGGLQMYHSTPESIEQELIPKGFKLLEVQSSNYPRPEPWGITIPAYKYAFQKM